MSRKKRVSNKNREQFTVSLSARPNYRLGEPILVELRLMNTSDKSYQLLKSGTPLEGQINENCFTVERDDEPISYDGKRVHWADPPADSYVVIGPGEGLTGKVDISLAYAIDQSGNYSVTLKAALFDAFQLSNEKKQPPRKRRHFTPLKLPSATVRFTVSEDGEPRLTEGETARRQSRLADISAREPSFNGGTANEQADVTTAHNNAQYFAALAVKQLEDTAASTNALYQTWFGAFDQGRYDTVKGVFKKIRDGLLTKAVIYDLSESGCDPDWNAYTFNGSDTVWICGNFWSMPMIAVNCMFSTVLHEWSHAFGGVGDHAYGDADCQTLATNDPGKAIDNGDSYENFAERLAMSDFGKTLTLVTDRSTFGKDEINALLGQGSPVVISDAFYILVDGCWPDWLGINTSSLGTSPSVTPNLTVTPAVAGMTIDFSSLEAEDSNLPASPQRFTWVCKVSFSDSNGFPSNPGQVLTAALTATLVGLSGSAHIRLICEPNPYEIDGPVSWLSTDARVFQIREGETRFGVTMGSSSAEASQFIKDVIANLNAGTSSGDTFENISTDPQASTLELSGTVGGTRVYNFAVAKVRYRGTIDVSNVRVFFRLIPVTSTSTQYNLNTTYRRTTQGTTTIPLLGLTNAGDLVSIPCFAEPRVDSSSNSLSTQTDPTNVRTITHDPGGDEVAAYFGCWLDINDTQPQFPLSPSPSDGPWTSGRKTIQEHIRGAHQCLVAEIAFDPDPIPQGSTPGGSDKLAQRNLSIVESANPGYEASRRILTTFDLHPVAIKEQVGLPSDELMIDWGDTPVDSIASIYIPEIDAGQIISLANNYYGLHGLRQIDDTTIRLPVGGIIYIPLPFGVTHGLTGLLSVELPATVRKGDEYTIVVRQLTNVVEKSIRSIAIESGYGGTGLNRWRQVVGSYQVTIPIRTKEMILPRESRLLSVLRWILKSVPKEDRWYPVFFRYVNLIGERVRALGGDPGKIIGTSDGSGGELIHEVEVPQRVPISEGKVTGLIYDCFGDFEGFILDVCGKEIRFKAREHQIEHLVEIAWRERITITVVSCTSDPHRPLSIVLRRAPEPHQS